MLLAYHFAEADPYRAATHNKGIMNGISTVVLATGNVTRAVESGAHAYASRHGRYTSLTRPHRRSRCPRNRRSFRRGHSLGQCRQLGRPPLARGACRTRLACRGQWHPPRRHPVGKAEHQPLQQHCTNPLLQLHITRNGQLLQANLKPASIFEDPVGPGLVLQANTRKIGYLGFESHYGNAQDQLIESLQSMAQEGIQELVLDLRYNSGGYLYIASTLASMLTPLPVLQTQPEFLRLQPNSKLTASYQDAVLRLSPFVQYVGNNAIFNAGSALPQLAIHRVYVLTTGATCSASESLINGLRGLGVTVHTIGDTTCGKPYGMTRQDNCATAYYPIEFRGVNALGESDFSNGFAPRCEVPADLDHERGDVREAQLSAALTHMQTGQCPATDLVANRSAATRQMSPVPLAKAQTPPQRQRPAMAILQPRH